jgi:putative FmdB family regulatory protein
MPTYEYTCRACGHTFDIVQKMSDDPLTHCPECGGELRKVFAAPAISFRGSGFYATDHGKKAKPSSDADTGEKKTDTKDAGAKGSGSDAKKTETKGDAGSGSASSGSASSGSDKKEGTTS